jgi:hypothetical protein
LNGREVGEGRHAVKAARILAMLASLRVAPGAPRRFAAASGGPLTAHQLPVENCLHQFSGRAIELRSALRNLITQVRLPMVDHLLEILASLIEAAGCVLFTFVMLMLLVAFYTDSHVANYNKSVITQKVERR